MPFFFAEKTQLRCVTCWCEVLFFVTVCVYIQKDPCPSWRLKTHLVCSYLSLPELYQFLSPHPGYSSEISVLLLRLFCFTQSSNLHLNANHMWYNRAFWLVLCCKCVFFCQARTIFYPIPSMTEMYNLLLIKFTL